MATPKRSHKRKDGTPSHLDETASPSTLPEPVVDSMATPNRSHKRKAGTPSHLDETSMLPEPVVVASGKKPSSGEKPSVAKYVGTKQHKFCVASFCSHTKLTNPALFVRLERVCVQRARPS